jgi:hypothetical protein
MNAPLSTAKTRLTPAQLRQRVLLLVLLLLSPFAAMNLWAIGKVLRARHAASAITSLGGQVFLIAKPGEMIIDPAVADESGVLGWHRSAFGDTSAVAVSFSGLKINDADLGNLNGINKVYEVCLDGTPITDAALDFLATRTEIRCLSLKDTSVTDAGLKKLKGLANLRRLWLDGTKITDAGLSQLNGLNMLTGLRLSRTQVTDAGVDRIEAIPHLQEIDLEGTAVSEAERTRLHNLCTSRIPPDDD